MYSGQLFGLASRGQTTLTRFVRHYANHYESLGIDRNSTQAQIKSAYYGLCKQYHPDMSKHISGCVKKFQDISLAYAVLRNARQREVYDKSIGIERVTNIKTQTTSQKVHQCKQDPIPPRKEYSVYNYDIGNWLRYHNDIKLQQDKCIPEFKSEVKLELVSLITCLSAMLVIIKMCS